MTDVFEQSQDVVDCALLGFLPFSYAGTEAQPHAEDFAVTHLAAALMAIDHFNDRNAVIVPELAGDAFQNCTVKLPEPVFVNTDGGSKTVAQYSMQMPRDKFCGVVGPYHNDPTAAAATFAMGLDIPLVAHAAYRVEFADKYAYPNMARVSSQLHSIAEITINSMVKQGRTDYLAVIAQISSTGDEIRKTMEKGARQAGFTRIDLYTVGRPFGPDEGAAQMLNRVKASGYRNIFLSVSGPTQLQFFADAAEALGMNDGEHFWMLSADGTDLDYVGIKASQNTNMSKLVTGMGSAWWMDGFTTDPENDAFLREWKKNDATAVERMNAVHPVRTFGTAGSYQANLDYFQTHLPQREAAFMYDAVMAMALGKCKELDKSGDAREEGTRNTHLQGILDTPFHGATGIVEYGARWSAPLNEDFPGNREKQSLTYGVYNFQKNADGEVRPYVTDILQGNPLTTLDWNETSQGPFIYANGLTTAPTLNRDQPDQNYLGKNVQAIGLSFMSLAVFLILASTAVIAWNHSKAPIRRAQPIFLYTISFGAAMMSFSILTLSFDESYGWTEGMLSAACMATPWLISLGYNIIYLALFSKLWRINAVMSAQRRVVLVRHAVGPFWVSLLTTVCLLGVWTAVDPWQWHRDEIDPVTDASYGKCRSENANRFLIPIIVLMGLSTLACGYMAFKCRDIDSQFSESNWIFYTFFVQFQVLLIGIPVLVILDTASAEATYLGRSLLIFVVVLTTIVLMLGPKLVALWRFIHNPPESSTQGRSNRCARARQPSSESAAGTIEHASKRRSVGSGNIRVTGLARASFSDNEGEIG